MRFLATGTGAMVAVVAVQQPMYGRGEPVYFWAEGGLVHWEDGGEKRSPSKNATA